MSDRKIITFEQFCENCKDHGGSDCEFHCRPFAEMEAGDCYPWTKLIDAEEIIGLLQAAIEDAGGISVFKKQHEMNPRDFDLDNALEALGIEVKP